MAVVNVGLHLRKRAKISSDLEAIVDHGAGLRFSFAELDGRADRFAHGLAKMGLGKGDRLAILLPNSHRYLDIYYGATRSGVIIVPINLRLAAAEVSFILQDSGAKALIFDDAHAAMAIELRAAGEVPIEYWINAGAERLDFASHYDALLSDVDGKAFDIIAGNDDPMLIMYTSGTTGQPKGTVHTHRSIEWSFIAVASGIDLRYRDRYLSSMPLYHIAAFNNLGTTLYRGGCFVILRKFDALETWQVLRDEQINVTLAVPPMLWDLLDTYSADLHRPLALRWILTGAQPTPLVLIEKVQALGLGVCQAFGLTEAGGVGTVMRAEDAKVKVGSIGKAFMHSEVRIVDAHGRDCLPGTTGEIVIRGEHNMRAYWNLPEETAATLRDGWVHTGDVGERDEDGFFYIRDRLKDMIISGGENIYPAEIEAVLRAHPGIGDVAVIGVPSEKWGEVPLAAVVSIVTGLTEENILNFCSGKIARYKVPKAVQFVDAIPRNATQKALKHVLRGQFSNVRLA